ncbi:peptidoglycan DD-metalloendopeptidase family protein [Pedobacter metabolipauper]|uniref:peptidoglycan DD-metalloendopeptidase family protein n=1 Tax=Pedobacter metabolipauper TaxID=425513 RepID=UPI001414FDA5|nr:peptidoglycan DD-metalloendopeptidase family protein [Pedobacter metabolipauper]
MHEQYKRKLISAGLDRTAMGTAWIKAADQSLEKALSIKIPFRETGYFSAERVPAAAYRFTAVKGKKIQVSIVKKPAEQFMIYLDIMEIKDNGKSKLIASSDTLNSPISFDADENATYLIRMQPELLRSGQYTLEITSGPSLGYPLSTTGKNQIQSFFGDGRDANSRKHEGVDIFSAFRTPVVAAAAGTVTRVNENNLGGKVVWLRPLNKDYTLYYAHLDRQIAVEGQQVLPGDTLGLMGNTGNARTTAPHLHFGIYTSSGTIDPFPYINPVVNPAPNISASLNNLNATVRTTNNTALHLLPDAGSAVIAALKSENILHIGAANGAWYRAELPNGVIGFIRDNRVSSVTKPLRSIKIKAPSQPVYDHPDSLAAVKLTVKAGDEVSLLGQFEDYQLIIANNNESGWIKSLVKP